MTDLVQIAKAWTRIASGRRWTGATAALLVALGGGPAALAQSRPAEPPDDHRSGLLPPLPASGRVASIVGTREGATDPDFTIRSRRYAARLRVLRHRHFGSMRAPEVRAAGLGELREFTDPAAFPPMIEELAREEDDVRLAVLDHFGQQGDDGQAALAWVAITDPAAGMRHEAMRRMVTPPATPVLRVLDQTLRSPRHDLTNHAGALAGTLGALEAIPLLIVGQATRDPRPTDKGDLAWIAIQTQQAFVANLQPVVGDNSGAFQPVIGVVSEGIVLRVSDAVVIVYRTLVHDALVALTTDDWGHPTDHLGYDRRAWWRWYNTEYLPFRNEQSRLAELAGEEPARDDATGGTPP